MFKLLLFISIMLAGPLAVVAQVPGDGQSEPEYPDSSYYPEDSSYYEPEVTIDTVFGGMDDEMPQGPTSFAAGGGFYVGPTFELTTLAPSALDPALDGDLVLYGVQLYAIIKGWLIGGHWTSATLYDMSTNYDEFQFSYGGFLTGYDLDIYKGLSFRVSALIGGGDLKMIKKRPELQGADGHEILERYRMESFFMLRPGASLGYSPLPFMDLRFAVDYLYPIGGDEVHDLKKLTYGLHVMLGFGK